MARKRRNTLPRYLEHNVHNRTYYYRNPGDAGKGEPGQRL